MKAFEALAPSEERFVLPQHGLPQSQSVTTARARAGEKAEPTPAAAEAPRPGDDIKGGALKMDMGKAPLFTLVMQYFPKALTAVANVSEYGLRKYNPGGPGTGWKRVPDGANRYGDGLVRHIVKESVEGPYDLQDSGLAHAAQAAWNALARLEILLEDGLLLDMRGNEIVDGKPVLGTARPVKI
jgi:hypothetical protein